MLTRLFLFIDYIRPGCSDAVNVASSFNEKAEPLELSY